MILLSSETIGLVLNLDFNTDIEFRILAMYSSGLKEILYFYTSDTVLLLIIYYSCKLLECTGFNIYFNVFIVDSICYFYFDNCLVK